MSFLDKINAAKNPAGAAGKKVNPLLKQAAPVTAAPAVPVAAKATTSPLKPNPLLKPAVAAPPPAATVAAAEPAATPVKKTLTLPFKKKTEEVVAVPVPVIEAQAVEAPVVEVPPAAEPLVEDFGASTVEEKATAQAPVPTEEKKTTRRTSNRGKRSDTATTESPATDIDTVGDEMADMPTTTMSFSEAAAVLTSPFADETWDAFKVEIEEELNAIVIDQDMNPGVLKVVLSELNIVYDKIAQPLHEARTLLENLTNKDDGTIVLVKSISLGGNNDMERKRAGFLSAMSYKPKSGGGNINLFEAAAEVRSRYNFLKSIHDRLKYKSDTLITMNGALKLERDFVARGDN